MFLSECLNFLWRLALQEKKLDDSSRLCIETNFRASAILLLAIVRN
jgi:hypothetical protein